MTQLLAADRRTGASSAWIYGEPSIDDLLQDPMVSLVLRRDQLSEDDLLAALAKARRRLNPEGIATSQAA